MNFLMIAELIILCSILWFLITQVLYPIISNTRWFPFFTEDSELDEKLVDAKQNVKKAQLEHVIKEEERKAKIIKLADEEIHDPKQ